MIELTDQLETRTREFKKFGYGIEDEGCQIKILID